MNDAASPASGASLDPQSADPRELMRALLPAARSEYIKAWEFLADPNTPIDRRRTARTRALKIADDHTVVVDFLRTRESMLKGDDKLNIRHLADELERHATALVRIGNISFIGLASADDLRPEALGCGKRYRDPARETADDRTKSRPGQHGAAAGGRGKRSDDRSRSDRSGKPFHDRGPKVSKDALGTSKHDSQLGDDLDEQTRAKLEALRQQLES